MNNNHFGTAKSIIGSVAADLIHKGIDPSMVVAALGSTIGNMLGLYQREETWEETANLMIKPMLADAKAAHRLLKRPSKKSAQ